MDVLQADPVSRIELVAFHVCGQEFCVEVVKVREVRSWAPATTLPHAPPELLGVINLRGSVLPIVDLASRLGYPAAQPTSRHAIMVVEIGTKVVGLLVESVSDIFSVDRGEIQKAPEVVTGETDPLVVGFITANDRMISMLAVDRIIRTEPAVAA